MMREFKPDKFVRYRNQLEQARRMGQVRDYIVDVVRGSEGRLDIENFADIQFQLDEFDAWQKDNLTIQEQFLADVDTYRKDPMQWDEARFSLGYAKYMKDGVYIPGGLLEEKGVNVVNHVTGFWPENRTEPLGEYKTTVMTPDDTRAQAYKSIWATPEEREMWFLNDYNNTKGFKKGVRNMYENLSLEQQQEYTVRAEQENMAPVVLFGLENVAPMYVPDTYRAPKEYAPKEKTVKNAPTVLDHATVTTYTKPIEVGYTGTKNKDEVTTLTFGTSGTQEITFDSRDYDKTMVSVQPNWVVVGGTADEFNEHIGQSMQSAFADYINSPFPVSQVKIHNGMTVYQGDEPLWINEIFSRTERKEIFGRRGKGHTDIPISPGSPIADEIYEILKEKKFDFDGVNAGDFVENTNIIEMTLEFGSTQGGIKRRISVWAPADDYLKPIVSSWFGQTQSPQSQESTSVGEADNIGM